MIECYHTGCKNHIVHFEDPEQASGPFCNENECNMSLLPNTHTDELGRIVLMKFPVKIPEITREVSAHEHALRPQANKNIKHVAPYDDFDLDTD